MDDVCHNSFDVAIPLCAVKCTMPGGSLPCSSVGNEHAPSSLTLGTNHATHLQANEASSVLQVTFHMHVDML